MSTPLGHGLAGLAVGIGGDRSGSELRTRALVGATAGLAPDLDFLPGLLIGDPARFHHGVTHSVGAVVVVALIAVMLAPRTRRWAWAGIAAAAYASHLLLDVLTYDPSEPIGLLLFWPLSEAYVNAPVTPLPRVLHSEVSPFNLHNLGVAALELTLFGLLAVGAYLLWRRRTSPADGSGQAPR
jgi:inner membrane protein